MEVIASQEGLCSMQSDNNECKFVEAIISLEAIADRSTDRRWHF
jgi:hypothetical protein